LLRNDSRDGKPDSKPEDQRGRFDDHPSSAEMPPTPQSAEAKSVEEEPKTCADGDGKRPSNDSLCLRHDP
jgi:hypothetical protein